MNKDSKDKNNQSGASRDNLRPSRTKDLIVLQDLYQGSSLMTIGHPKTPIATT